VNSPAKRHVPFEYFIAGAIHHHALFEFILLNKQRLSELSTTPGKGFLDKIP
jgi:hypothetical protein